jgi:hypothetical protein
MIFVLSSTELFLSDAQINMHQLTKPKNEAEQRSKIEQREIVSVCKLSAMASVGHMP